MRTIMALAALPVLAIFGWLHYAPAPKASTPYPYCEECYTAYRAYELGVDESQIDADRERDRQREEHLSSWLLQLHHEVEAHREPPCGGALNPCHVTVDR